MYPREKYSWGVDGFGHCGDVGLALLLLHHPKKRSKIIHLETIEAYFRVEHICRITGNSPKVCPYSHCVAFSSSLSQLD